MEAAIGAGTPILMVQRGNPPVQFHGTVLASMGNVVAVKLPDSWSGAADAEVAIITGKPGGRRFARGRLAKARANVVSFELFTEWSMLDVRAAARYPTEMGAEVISILGDSRQAGKVIDLSQGGLGVVVSSKPGGREVAVAMRAGAFSATLPCRIVQVEPTEGGALLHLQFMELTSGQQAFVRNVVASVEAAMLFREQKAS